MFLDGKQPLQRPVQYSGVKIAVSVDAVFRHRNQCAFERRVLRRGNKCLQPGIAFQGVVGNEMGKPAAWLGTGEILVGINADAVELFIADIETIAAYCQALGVHVHLSARGSSILVQHRIDMQHRHAGKSPGLAIALNLAGHPVAGIENRNEAASVRSKAHTRNCPEIRVGRAHGQSADKFQLAEVPLTRSGQKIPDW